jgi:hypothetical protein
MAANENLYGGKPAFQLVAAFLLPEVGDHQAYQSKL